MAKIKVAGNAIVLTSALKREDVEELKRFSPDSLCLKDENGNEEFRIDFAPDTQERVGKIREFGVTFDSVSRGEIPHITVTQAIECVGENVEEFVLNEFGIILSKVIQVENQALRNLETVHGNLQEIKQNIEICD